jgi:hypothetical protein
MAAVRAHKVLPHSSELMTALAKLLAHTDPYVRRAAAESYVALDPRGAEAPALKPLHADPAHLVVMTASGWLREPEHESAELKGFIRAVLRMRDADGRGFAATVARWHRVLWLYSPNPRAVEVMSPITHDRLESDAAELTAALAQLVDEQHVPPHIEQLQVHAVPDDSGYQLDLQGFVRGRHDWTTETRVKLPALRALDAFVWGPHDDPWNWIYAAGSFALAVACAVEAMPDAFRGHAKELELATCVGCSGEQVLLGMLTPAGIRFSSASEV